MAEELFKAYDRLTKPVYNNEKYLSHKYYGLIQTTSTNDILTTTRYSSNLVAEFNKFLPFYICQCDAQMELNSDVGAYLDIIADYIKKVKDTIEQHFFTKKRFGKNIFTFNTSSQRDVIYRKLKHNRDDIINVLDDKFEKHFVHLSDMIVFTKHQVECAISAADFLLKELGDVSPILRIKTRLTNISTIVQINEAGLKLAQSKYQTGIDTVNELNDLTIPLLFSKMQSSNASDDVKSVIDDILQTS